MKRNCLLTDIISKGKAKIIKKLKYHASNTIKVTTIWCLNQFPYLYKIVEVSTKESSIFEISGV